MEMKKKPARKVSLIFFPLFIVLFIGADTAQLKAPEVPYVPTPEQVVAKMLEMAGVSENDVLYDLGCGDGRIVITAARELGCRGVGIDIDPQRIKESRENAAKAGVEDRVKFLLMDLFQADIRQASVVTLYLLSAVNLKLRPKLLKELRPGTRVVSHDFDMDDWAPDNSAVMEIADSPVKQPYFFDEFFIDNYWNKHKVFFWIIPANVTGTWEWTMSAVSGKDRFKLTLEQAFQEVGGRAFQGSTSIPLLIKDGKIRGSELEFILEAKIQGHKERLHFQAAVSGHRMGGQYSMEGKSGVKGKWQAERIPSTFISIEK